MIINISDRAKEKLDEVLSSKTDGKALRIHIAAYGWGGPSFGMALEEPQENDLKISVDGFDFIMEEGFDQIYNHFDIGYSDSFLRKGFTIMPDRGGRSSC